MFEEVIREISLGNYITFLKEEYKIYGNPSKWFFTKIKEYEYLVSSIKNINEVNKNLKICGFYPILGDTKMPYIISLSLNDKKIGWLAKNEKDFLIGQRDIFFKNEFLDFKSKRFWNTAFEFVDGEYEFINGNRSLFEARQSSEYKIIKDEFAKFSKLLNSNK